MIVRILGDGPYDLPDTAQGEIERLDEALGAAIERGDAAATTTALDQLVAHIRAVGTPLAADDLRPSALVVPHPGSTLEELEALLASEP